MPPGHEGGGDEDQSFQGSPDFGADGIRGLAPGSRLRPPASAPASRIPLLMSTRTPPADVSEELARRVRRERELRRGPAEPVPGQPVLGRRRMAPLLPGTVRAGRRSQAPPRRPPHRRRRASGPSRARAARALRGAGSGGRGRAGSAPRRRRADRREHAGEPDRSDGDHAARRSRSSCSTRTAGSSTRPRAQAEQSKISFTHLVSWAVIQAREGVPRHERRLRGGRSGEPARVRREEIRFGLAVDVAKSDGSRTLLVPNVKGAEKMTLRASSSRPPTTSSRAPGRASSRFPTSRARRSP